VPVLTLPHSDNSSLGVRAKALVFEDDLSRALLARIQQIAPSEATVLVTGETGTGKEIVARQLHNLSARRTRPFVAVNCGAFSESLVESELFGHERGAFTGAHLAKAGWFEAAEGGTLFLDEIGDLARPLQVKLLRVLQEREVVRVGSRQPIPIDVRLIAATNVDLQDAVQAGRFRGDLYYRLNVATLTIPPLRDRPEDIPPLVRHFSSAYGLRLGVGDVAVTPEALARLLTYPWPGNIRELENIIHQALLVCRDGRITVEDLRLPIARLTGAEPSPPSPPSPVSPDPGARSPFGALSARGLDAVLHALFDEEIPNLHAHMEEQLMRAAYNYCDRNQLQTARLLGISRNVVRARLIQIGELAGSLRNSPATPARMGYLRAG
jgi:sigma-54-specific transcriptional regulator